MDSEGTEEVIEAYKDINRIASLMEYELKMTSIQDNRAVFFYTEAGNAKVVKSIEEINDILSSFKIEVKAKVIDNPKNIIYRDNDQIAIIQ